MRSAIVAFALLFVVEKTQACTTLICGKGATQDGSVMCTHSDDGEGGADARIVPIAAKDHAAGSMRPIYYDTENYPRHVGTDRSPVYKALAGQNNSVKIGEIPEVAHTYSLHEATYGIMNEHMVGIGESTCSGRYGASSVMHGGKALMSVDSLSRIALERCKTSRCAVKMMGDLAVKHGYYGAGSFEGSAESLMVVDGDEAFIFHILPDDTHTSAIWAAQRVPDEECGVVANMFVIRAVNFTDSRNFLGSDSVHAVATKYKYWSPEDGLLDFTAVYSDGEYAHQYYSGRRMWGAFRLFAPSTKMSATYDDLRYNITYPVTTKPDKKQTPQSLMAIHRDHYDDTPYDTRKGVAAGPWGNPDRWSTRTNLSGHWERTIGLYRTSQTHVVQARSWLAPSVGGIIWYGPHAAAGTVFVPFSVGMATLPAAYTKADPSEVQRDSAYWAFRYVFNVAHIKYNLYMQEISILQNKLETAGAALVKSTSTNSTSAEMLTAAYTAHAEAVLTAWWKLPDHLIGRFADGWIDDSAPGSYPNEWLKEVGYKNGPPDIPSEKPHPHMV